MGQRLNPEMLRPFVGRVALSGASPPAAEVRADQAISAPWSAPLLRDVLTFKSPGEDLEVAALGVSVAFLVLLNEHTVPGWLPAALDEQRTPLCGLMPPTPSFCFTKDQGVLVPIGVVRPMPLTPPTSPARHRHPNLQPHPPHPTQLRTFDPQMHQYVLLLVERLRMTVGELVMAYACVERVLVLHPTTMRVNSIRPMLLGTCIIACKTSRDGDLSLWQVTPLSPFLHPSLRSLLILPPSPDAPTPCIPHGTHTLRRARPPAVPRETERRPRRRRGLARLHRAPDARGAALELEPHEP